MDPSAPAAGEVCVRLMSSGVNPSDVQLRAGVSVGGMAMFPAIIPHSDGAGVIDAVGQRPSRFGPAIGSGSSMAAGNVLSGLLQK